jgi:hypothetical protein
MLEKKKIDRGTWRFLIGVSNTNTNYKYISNSDQFVSSGISMMSRSNWSNNKNLNLNRKPIRVKNVRVVKNALMHSWFQSNWKIISDTSRKYFFEFLAKNTLYSHVAINIFACFQPIISRPKIATLQHCVNQRYVTNKKFPK